MTKTHFYAALLHPAQQRSGALCCALSRSDAGCMTRSAGPASHMLQVLSMYLLVHKFILRTQVLCLRKAPKLDVAQD